MSKSVLVIDTPEACRSCYLRGFTLDLQYCRVKKKDIKDDIIKVVGNVYEYYLQRYYG